MSRLKLVFCAIKTKPAKKLINGENMLTNREGGAFCNIVTLSTFHMCKMPPSTMGYYNILYYNKITIIIIH